MIPSINRILNALQNIKFYGSTLKKIHDQIIGFDDYKSNKDRKKFSFEREIKLEGIQFSYNDKRVLSSTSLDVKKGTTIGIVGSSGSSTLVDLINGLLKPTKGSISIDGINIEEIIKSWQKSIGYVGQEIYLMDNTIKANIAFGTSEDEIKIDKVYQALEAAQLSSFISELKYGINTRVGERGIQLSGGQKTNA